MDDFFQLVEQLLRAAEAERGNQYRAFVLQGVLDNGLEALPALGAVFVQAVAVGAFQHEDVGALGRCGGHQQRRVGSAQVAGENDARVVARGRVGQVDFDVGRAEDVAGALQADARHKRVGFDQGEPLVVRQGQQALFDPFDIARYLFVVPAEAELECVFEDNGQQLGRRLATEDRPLEPCSQQIGNPPDVVDMHVGDDQRLDGLQREFDGQLPCARPAIGGGFAALEKAAVDQQAAGRVHMQLMAGAGHTFAGAVMLDGWIAHG